MWTIEVAFAGVWQPVAHGFPTQDRAEWAIAEWKAKNDCLGDPFRCVKAPRINPERSEFPTPVEAVSMVTA